MENFRRAIGLRIKEVKEVYEGEVTELTPVETENPMGGESLCLGEQLKSLLLSSSCVILPLTFCRFLYHIYILIKIFCNSDKPQGMARLSAMSSLG